jgi:mannose-6-phosphate isomerase-like protein (cupin superfamily)
MQFIRVFTDSEGETHFEDLEIDFNEVNFAPPAPPVLLTEFTPATQWAFFSLPPGWFGDWHPTPARQIFFYLSGQAEAEVSDGTVRRFGPGDATIVEDTTGKGHRSRVVGDVPLLLAVVQMPNINTEKG